MVVRSLRKDKTATEVIKGVPQECEDASLRTPRGFGWWDCGQRGWGWQSSLERLVSVPVGCNCCRWRAVGGRERATHGKRGPGRWGGGLASALSPHPLPYCLLGTRGLGNHPFPFCNRLSAPLTFFSEGVCCCDGAEDTRIVIWCLGSRMLEPGGLRGQERGNVRALGAPRKFSRYFPPVLPPLFPRGRP